MKRRLRFHAAAERDFTFLAARSEREWGKARTRRYLYEIDRKIQSIVENPMLGRDADLPRPGLRRISAGSEVIFYIHDDNQVQIVRILHEAMDFEARLR